MFLSLEPESFPLSLSRFHLSLSSFEYPSSFRNVKPNSVNNPHLKAVNNNLKSLSPQLLPGLSRVTSEEFRPDRCENAAKRFKNARSRIPAWRSREKSEALSSFTTSSSPATCPNNRAKVRNSLLAAKSSSRSCPKISTRCEFPFFDCTASLSDVLISLPIPAQTTPDDSSLVPP